jgi:hypothetical protein
MRRFSNGGVVDLQVAGDGAHDHFARVQPHTYLGENPLPSAHVLAVLLDRFLHPQRRIARAHRVILVGDRRSEQRHDPVAHHLVHRPS